MEQEYNWNMHSINLFNTIKIYPDKIKYLYCSDNYLCVTRENYSEIYNIVYHKDKIFFDELARIEQCEYLYRISGSIVLVKAFEIKMLGEFNRTFPYSAEMRTTSIVNGNLYTHHLNGQTRYWNIQEQTFEMVQIKNSPFHITDDGVKGYARNIQGAFTTLCQTPNYLFIGDGDGYVHIYETKYLTFINKIKKHEGPILSIIENLGAIYLTGCDSKIVCLKQIKGKFIATSDIRGQSHDVLSICFIDGKTMVSGGLSTDICYYSLQNGDFINNYTNRPSLTNKKLISSNNRKHLILINQGKHLELWKYNLNQSDTQFLLKFQSKNVIEQAEIDFDGKYIAYSTSTQLVILKVEQDYQLTKFISFKASRYIRFIKHKLKVVVLTTEGGIYLINLKNKAIKLIQTIKSITLPSDFDFDYPRMMVGSKLEQKIILIDFKEKTKQVIEGKYHLCQLHEKGFLINKDFKLEIHIDEQQRVLDVRIPLRRLRFGGIYPGTNLWFGCGDGMVLLVKHLFGRNGKYFANKQLEVKKKFTTKETMRAYQVVITPNNLGLIPIDFKQMLQGIQNPIISKKVF